MSALWLVSRDYVKMLIYCSMAHYLVKGLDCLSHSCPLKKLGQQALDQPACVGLFLCNSASLA